MKELNWEIWEPNGKAWAIGNGRGVWPLGRYQDNARAFLSGLTPIKSGLTARKDKDPGASGSL